MNIKQYIYIFPFSVFLFGYYLSSLFFKTTDILVPNLIGKNLNEASKVLSDYNLNLRILTYKEDNELADGTVLDQTPYNQKVKINRPVYLTVSKKSKDFKIPDFRGKKLEEIEPELKAAGIRSKVYLLESSLPANSCIGHLPSCGKTIGIKEKMILYISSGNKKPVIFPDMRGLKLSEVLSFLDQNELRYSLVVEHNQAYNHEFEYIVIDQRPLSGSLVNLTKNLNVQLQIRRL